MGARATREWRIGSPTDERHPASVARLMRPSSITRMPQAVRDEIAELRELGFTIDEIIDALKKLHGVTPSRSALGRHIKGLDKIGEKVRRSRAVAEALVRELGDAPESRTARLNIELLHSAILDLFMKAADGEAIDKDGNAALAGDPEGLMFFAKALDHLGRAKKSAIEAENEAEKKGIEKGKRLAAKAVEGEAVRQGLSAETIKAIKASIFGALT